jgi:signal transduction histidine kinase
MKLKTKLTMGFISGALLLVVMGGVNVFYLSDINSAAQSVAESNVGEVKNSANLSLMLSKLNGDMRMYLLNNHLKKDEDLKNNRENVLTDLIELKSAVNGLSDSTEMGVHLADDEAEASDESGEVEEIEILIELVHSYEKLIEKTLDIVETDGVVEGTSFYLGNGDELQNKVLSGSKDLYDDAIKEIEEESHKVIFIVSRAKQLMVALASTAFVVSLIIGLLISRNITRRIVGLEGATRKIKDGNFDVKIVVGSEKDEINSLQSSFQLMVNQLNTSTISIEQLETEIERRQKVERQLQDSHQDLEKRVLERTAQLENAKIEAESANRSKSDFLANMSHELRTPLNHIIGFTELITDEKFGPLNDIQREYLGDSLSSGKHLLTLINDILDLSKVEAGKLELHLGDVEIQELLQKCLVMFKEKAMKHSLKLEVVINNDVPKKIIADHMKMKQITYNLVSNAVKFTPDGGEILIKVSICEMIEGEERNILQFSVTDNGIGIDKKDQANIFNPFEQAGDAPESPQGGTGLGLALTKKFIELHGGDIEVQSKGLGKGATFTFTLPQIDRRKA